MALRSVKQPATEEIKAIVDADPGYYYRTIKRLYPDFYDLMNDGRLAENIYCWLFNNGEPYLCECGRKRGFEGMRLGYRSHCSAKCAANDKEVKRKREATNLDRFGGTNSHHSTEVRAKFHQTMMARYGVMNALQNPELSVKARTSFQQHDIAEVRRRAEQTNEIRYGVPHASQNATIKAKIADTHLRRHGVDTPLRSPNVIATTIEKRRAGFMDQLAERVTSADALFDEFVGVNLAGKRILYPWRCRQCDQVFDGHLDDGLQPRCPVCFPITMSRGQTELRDFLISLGITVTTNDRSLIAPLELDLMSRDQQLAIEYNGLYYHHDGAVSKAYHLNKLQRCQASGYRLIHIFESEWLFQRPIVRSRLAAILGKNDRIFARKTRMMQITGRQAREFLETNHLQGSCPSSLNLALYNEDDIIAVMTFGKARFNKAFNFELLRFASRLGLNVTGGASKLFAGFKRIYPAASVVSYADRRWSIGCLYRSLGFTYEHSSPPNYYYSLDKTHLLSRMQFQKHKLSKLLTNFDPNLSEAENMYANGFVRIWDCGNDVFGYRP